MKDKLPQAPRHLRAATWRWWASVVDAYELEPHHVRLLTLAAETWERVTQAREVIARDGLTSRTRDGGVKLHPAVRVEQDGKVIFARLLRELDLDVTSPSEAKRPPVLRSIRGTARIS